MADASTILRWIQESLDELELSYDFGQSGDWIKTQIPLDGKLNSMTVHIHCAENRYMVNAFISLDADADCRTQVSEYLMRANYGLVHGNFEMDFSDGEIRFRLTVDCEDRTGLSETVVMRSLFIPKMMYEKYGDGLVAVMYGIKTPAEAVADADGE